MLPPFCLRPSMGWVGIFLLYSRPSLRFRKLVSFSNRRKHTSTEQGQGFHWEHCALASHSRCHKGISLVTLLPALLSVPSLPLSRLHRRRGGFLSMVQSYSGNYLSMQTYSSLLEPRYPGCEVHRSAPLHRRQWRYESFNRCVDSLSSDPYGLGLEYKQGSENYTNRYILTGHIVSFVAPYTWRLIDITDHPTVCVPSQSFGSVRLLLSITMIQHGALWTYSFGPPWKTA